MGIPEWVSYEVTKRTFEVEKHNRPTWIADDVLHQQGIAPNNDRYAVSGMRELTEVKTDYWFVRGHLCNKDSAYRISMETGYNTHTVINCVPELQWQNNGIWKQLEVQVNNWADQYGSVWVICGPVFFNKTPSMWLGEEDEVKAAIPDALFKVVIRKKDSGIEILTFIIPNILPKAEKSFCDFLSSLGRLEHLTGLKFITNVSFEKQLEIKSLYSDLSVNEKKQVIDSW